MLALEVVALIALVFWVVLLLDRRRRWPTDVVLPLNVEELTEDSSGVLAIVPARNEAEVLPTTLPSLLQQEVSRFRVVLVDDGSTDGTAQLASRLAKQLDVAEKLTIVEAGPRMEGWSGKVHAQLSGYVTVVEEAAEEGAELPDWLLLTDADIRHRPDSVRSLLLQAQGAAGERGYDLVSVMARLRATTIWERLIVPAFVFFFQLLYPFRRVADPRSRIAAAAGGCVLIRRTAFEEAGGFAEIGGEIIDDVALGRAVKRRGGAVWLGFDTGVESVRPYDDLGELWRMVSRTAFTQLWYRWDLLLATLVGLGVLLVSPPVVALASLIGILTREGGDPGSLVRALIWSLLTWGMMAAEYLPAVRHHRVPLVYAAALPFSSLLFGLMTISSAKDYLLGKGPSWRGRSYGSSRMPPSSPP